MAPEEQRIAIAEACPETIKQINGNWYYFYRNVWRQCRDDDPLEDLNAMHEAEKVLTREQRYSCILTHYSYNRTIEHPDFDATASQRAEAFLRTIGKWKE